MNTISIEFADQKKCPIIVDEDGAFDYASYFQNFNASKIIAVSDENVWNIYSKRYSQFDSEFVLKPGEHSKSIQEYEKLTRYFAENQLDRNALIVGIGGGVVCDLVGFAASTFKRGVKFCYVATSLMAQVDAAIGGKCGIDLPEGKNLLGTFALPEAVICDIHSLKTLPSREVKNGMAEVIKYGFISKAELVNQTAFDLGNAAELVKTCAKIKAEIVNSDPFETKGLRSVLNFGHTVGHAIEQNMNYEGILHGEAVAVGMIAESRIGEILGITEAGIAKMVKETVERCGLPTQIPAGLSTEKLMNSMANDKKNRNTNFSMALITKIGACNLTYDVPKDIVEEVIRNL